MQSKEGKEHGGQKVKHRVKVHEKAQWATEPD